MLFSSIQSAKIKHNNIRLFVRWIGRLVTLMLGLIIPAGLSVMVLLSLYSRAVDETENSAEDLLEYVYLAPDFWKFQGARIQAIFEHDDEYDLEMSFKLFDEVGLISESVAEPGFPNFSVCRPVVFLDEQVATLCGSVAMAQTITMLAALWLASIGLASASYWYLTVRPVAMLDETIQALVQKAEEAKAADRAKSEFLSIMSHEIRTPLNGILGMSELLNATCLTRDQRLYSDTIASSGTALLSIINDILDFSKIDALQVSLNETEFDLRKVAEDVGRLLSVQAAHKGLELNVQIEPALPWQVKGDAAKFRQVLLNLAGNAVKFTDEGHVLIKLEAGAINSGEQVDVRVSVSDTGPGIAADSVKSVFEKFSRLDGSYTREQEGTGLGLAISQGLVAVMGGAIDLQSTVGHGSTFSFTVGFRPMTDEDEITFLDQTRKSVAGKRVLVIEENEKAREILRDIFQHWGVVAEFEMDARNALKTIGQLNRPEFDLIILDQDISGVSVAMFCDALSKNGVSNTFPVVVLSSIFSKRMDIEGREPEFLSTIPKPISEYAVLDALQVSVDLLKGDQPSTADTNRGRDLAAIGDLSPLLIVDDNATNRLLAEKFVQKLGLDCVIATNGDEAIQQFIKVRPKAILMDVSMPVLDGFQATSEIRKVEARSGGDRAYIVGVTANTTIGFDKKCQASGMDAYLAKPISMQKLYSALSAAQPSKAA